VLRCTWITCLPKPAKSVVDLALATLALHRKCIKEAVAAHQPANRGESVQLSGMPGPAGEESGARHPPVAPGRHQPANRQCSESVQLSGMPGSAGQESGARHPPVAPGRHQPTNRQCSESVQLSGMPGQAGEESGARHPPVDPGRHQPAYRQLKPNESVPGPADEARAPRRRRREQSDAPAPGDSAIEDSGVHLNQDRFSRRGRPIKAPGWKK
jgi:hypothetical protein